MWIGPEIKTRDKTEKERERARGEERGGIKVNNADGTDWETHTPPHCPECRMNLIDYAGAVDRGAK